MAEAIMNRIATLENIPLFSFLNAEELREIQPLFEEQTYSKGETICEAGEEGETFYIVLSGELEVLGGEHHDQVVNRLGPGDFFGELALVLGGPRAATVMVSQRAQLLALSKEPFHRFCLQNAKVLEYFSRVISQRLSSTVMGYTSAQDLSTTVISVVGRPGLRGKTLVASALAGLLKDFTAKDILLVEAQSIVEGSRDPADLRLEVKASRENIRSRLTARRAEPTKLMIGIKPDASQAELSEFICDTVIKLSNDFPYMVLDLGSGPPALLGSVGEFTDVLIKVVDRVEPSAAHVHYQTFQVINLFNRSSRAIPINHCEPFVIPKGSSLGSNLDTQVRALRRFPPPSAGVPLHRLARKILGKTVGLALGGGSAFGLAHLGVLKVLEANRLPIDILTGCSFGSLVAIGYAAGIPCSRLIELAQVLGARSRLLALAMQDWTFLATKPGFLDGEGIKATFEPFLGNKQTFEDLIMPCRAVATDIENGERVELGTGRLADAFRASCSVPVILSPVRRGDRVLLDGGVCDPVPAEVTRAMGADICIAVNVVPPMKKGVESMLSRGIRMVNMFNPLTYLPNSQNYPSLLDVFMSSLQTLQYELGNFKAISADVRINPDLSDFTWIEFYRNKELIEKGVEAAERALPAIHRALEGNGTPAVKNAPGNKQVTAV